MSEGAKYGTEGDPTLHPIRDVLDSLGPEPVSGGEGAATPGDSERLSEAARIKAQCIQEVEEGIRGLRHQLDAGSTPDRKADKLAQPILHMAQRAAAAENHETFAFHLNTLLEMPELSSTTIAAACFAGVTIQDGRSLQILNAGLRAEMDRQRDAEGAPATPLLYAVINECVDYGVLPNEWIEKYGIDARHHFQLLSNYYASAVRGSTGEAKSYFQSQLDSLTSRLLSQGTFPDNFIFEQVWYALGRVQTPELRAALIERFMRSGDTVYLNAYTFDMLNWVGITVLDDPRLANQKTVGYFDRTIEACGQKLQEANMPIYDVVSRQLFWRTRLAVHNGASAEEVVDLIDIQVSSLLASDIPDTHGGLGQNLVRNREYVERTREKLLTACAHHFATQEDFASANALLSHIMTEEGLGEALVKCLESAKNNDQIDAIRPDDLTIALSPGLDRHFTFAAAKLAGNTDEIADTAIGYAQDIQGDSDKSLSRSQLRTAYETLVEHDTTKAAQTARQVLVILREAGEPAHETLYLTESLVRAGDAEEPARAKEYIDRSTPNNFDRLHNTWQLSKVL